MNITLKKLNKMIIAIFFIIILSTNVFAKENYFLIEIQKGYLLSEDSEGSTKLIAAREDGKVNFNIQVFNTGSYYEFSKKGLNDLIEVASKELEGLDLVKVNGKISKLNKYSCYELQYLITAKDTNKEMHVRQIYLYEDTYSYIITIGGESEEVLRGKDIEKTLSSFKIEDYKRDNVLKSKDSGINFFKDNILWVIAGIFVLILIFAILILVKVKKSKKNKFIKKEKKSKNKNKKDKGKDKLNKELKKVKKIEKKRVKEEIKTNKKQDKNKKSKSKKERITKESKKEEKE